MTQSLSRRAFLAMGRRAPEAGGAPARRAAEVASNCLSLKGVACRICGEHCDAGAIRFRPRVGGRARPEVTADCNGCGACVGVCPAAAISLVEMTERGEPA